MLRASGTFGGLLRRAVRYSRLFFPYTQLLLEERGANLGVICLHPDPSPFGQREQVICLFLGMLLVWGRALAMKKMIPTAISMRWRGPGDRRPFDAFFGCAAQFKAAEDAMLFHQETLGSKLPGQTPELTPLLESVAEASIRRMTAETGVIEQVRDSLSGGRLSNGASECAVAMKMGVTVRTLRRHLAEKGISFRQLRADCLRARAQDLLLDAGLPIAEISYRLGYAEPANFCRAFRRWTGVSPARWRSETGGIAEVDQT